MALPFADARNHAFPEAGFLQEPEMSFHPALPPAQWPRLENGWVWLCGAGPGDPGLLTLHALNALRQADVIVHDALVNEDILDWAPQARRIHAGKRGGKPSAKQADICDTLIDLARQGLRVLRLKGGDPFTFGRGAEEARALMDAGVPLKVVPGITSGIGGLAYAGIPLTERGTNQAVTFVTGHDADGGLSASVDWQALAKVSGTIVIYMGMKHAQAISDALIAGGRSADEPVAVVMAASTDAQRVLETTLGTLDADIRAAGLEPPALLAIGKSVLIEGEAAPRVRRAAYAIAAE